MTKCMRPILAMAVALLVIDADLRSADAQGFNIGGAKVQAGGNQSNNNDENNDGSNQGGRRSRQGGQSGNQSGNQDDENIPSFQQFIPGQGGQGQNQGQGGSNRSRRSNQSGQFQGNQQFQNQQLQNWQQGNQKGLSIGQWNGGKWQGTHNAEKWTQAFGANQKPFSSQWYKDHPKAWKYDNNKNSNINVWVGGSLPGVYSFLGWGNVPQQYRAYYGNNVQHFDRSHYGQWYPLGVFSLMTGPGDPGTRMVQLAVDQHGHVAGNYYDMITNSNYSISGDIRQQSQRVSWSLNKNQAVRFRASLYQLLQPYGPVTVQLPGGEQQWQFVRLEN